MFKIYILFSLDNFNRSFLLILKDNSTILIDISILKKDNAVVQTDVTPIKNQIYGVFHGCFTHDSQDRHTS